MGVSKKVQEQAQRALLGCKSLAEAEAAMGFARLSADGIEDTSRDKGKQATVWGLFDGYIGRPSTTAGLRDRHNTEYFDAYDVGKQLAEQAHQERQTAERRKHEALASK